MPDVLILSLAERSDADHHKTSHSHQGDCVGAETGDGCTGRCADHGADQQRVPVLACAEALRAGGADPVVLTAHDNEEIDAALKPVEAGDARLVIAAESDAQIRAVLRRMVRRYAPPPSKRPEQLPAGRTVFDLPPVALLPLSPAVPPILALLGLPTRPELVAAAIIAGSSRRLDLLRHDGGSVTIHRVLLGGRAPDGTPTGWRGRIEVDAATLSDADEPILAVAINNLGPADLDGLPLLPHADAQDAQVEVAVAVPGLRRRLARPALAQIEVRRARGRAVSVSPRDGEVPFVDDGATGALTHKRSWWVEPSVWAVYG